MRSSRTCNGARVVAADGTTRRSSRQNEVDCWPVVEHVAAKGVPVTVGVAVPATYPPWVPELPVVSHDSPWTTWSCTTGALEPGGIGDCAIE